MKYLVQTFALAAVLAFTGQASAIVDYQAGNGGLEAFQITWDGKQEYALAGGISLHKTGGDENMRADYVSVCTDIGATIYLGNTYTFSGPEAFSGHSGIQPTWGAGNQSPSPVNNVNAMAAIQAAADIFYAHSSVLSGGTLTEKAALQLAVWEALYDTTANSQTLNLSNGRFTVNPNWGDSEAVAKAALWVASVNAHASYSGFLLVPSPEYQYSAQAQELFYNVTPVPEPATILAACLLLLPLGASTARILRRSNRNRAP
jgi:hypothetical protein